MAKATKIKISEPKILIPKGTDVAQPSAAELADFPTEEAILADAPEPSSAELADFDTAPTVQEGVDAAPPNSELANFQASDAIPAASGPGTRMKPEDLFTVRPVPFPGPSHKQIPTMREPRAPGEAPLPAPDKFKLQPTTLIGKASKAISDVLSGAGRATSEAALVAADGISVDAKQPISLTGLPLVPSAATKVIGDISASMGLALGPKAVQAIADLPAGTLSGGGTVEMPDGRLVKMPEYATLGEALDDIFLQPIPAIGRAKAEAVKKLELTRDEIADGKLDAIVLEAQKAASSLGIAAVDLIQETPGGLLIEGALLAAPRFGLGLLSRGTLTPKGVSKINSALSRVFTGAQRQETAIALRESTEIATDELAASQRRYMDTVRRIIKSIHAKVAPPGKAFPKYKNIKDIDQAAVFLRAPVMTRAEAADALARAQRSFERELSDLKTVIPAKVRKAEARLRAVAKATPETGPSSGETVKDFSLRRASERQVATKNVGVWDKVLTSSVEGALRDMGPTGQKLLKLIKQFLFEMGNEATEAWMPLKAFARELDKDPARAKRFLKIVDPLRRPPWLSSEEDMFRASADFRQFRTLISPFVDRLDNLGGRSFRDEIGDLVFRADNAFAYYYDFENKKVRSEALDLLARRIRDDKERLAWVEKQAKIRAIEGKTPAARLDIEVAKTASDDFNAMVQASRDGRFAIPEATKEFGKLGLKGFSENVEEVLDRTIQAFAERLTRRRLFGPDDIRLNNLLDTLVREENRDAKFLSGVKNEILEGRLSPPGKHEDILNGVLVANVFDKMGLSAIKNFFTAPVNAAAVTDLESLTATVVKYLKREGRDESERFWKEFVQRGMRRGWAESTGTPESALEGVKVFTKRIGVEDFFKFTGNYTAEKSGRIMAGDMGMYYANKQARLLKAAKAGSIDSKSAASALKELGFSDKEILQIKRHGQLSKTMNIRAANAVMRSSNLETNFLDIPQFWRSDPGKILFQFSSWPYRQNIYLRDMLARKDASGLATWGTGAFLSGLTSQTALDLLTGKEIDDVSAVRTWRMATGRDDADAADMVAEVLRNMGNGVGYGIAGSAIHDLFPELFGDEPRKVKGTRFLGPTIGTLAETTEVLAGLAPDAEGEIGEGEINRAGRFALRRVPGAGQILAGQVGGAMFPREDQVTNLQQFSEKVDLLLRQRRREKAAKRRAAATPAPSESKPSSAGLAARAALRILKGRKDGAPGSER